MPYGWYKLAITILNQAVRAEGVVTDFAYIENDMSHEDYDRLNVEISQWSDAMADRILNDD